MPQRSTRSPPIATAAAPGSRSASLADVALLAGVSTGTVSRTLSHPAMISEATRLRVLDAVNRLGYVANGAARALAMRRTLTVGAIVPRFGQSSFPTMIQALEATLAAHGYTLLLSAPAHGSVDQAVLLRKLLERGVDAVALLGAEHSREVFTLLATHRTPFVMMWAAASPEGAAIGFDENAASALLIGHLAELGHRTLGYIGGRTTDNERARLRLRGLTRAVAARGMSLSDDALLETEHGFREGFEAMTTIIKRRTKVTAVVCGSDYLAAGAMAALAAAGITVPADMSVASFNDNDFAPYLQPALTTIHLPIREIGESAGLYLAARLLGTPTPPARLLDVSLMPRASTGPCPPARTEQNSKKVGARRSKGA